MTFQAAYENENFDDDVQETSIIDKIRKGRLTALAAHRAKFSDAENVVSIFDREVAIRAATPVFHTSRVRQEERQEKAKLAPLLLLNPIAA
jgi:hypothetical protein